ncbi:helix-turn-helix domain-containing protein [Bradyrhizobium erythrophlei]|uniref:helix-turn-helix domain-containing protein n=1 Tax=Bradyrhizobium erythrophlei TaxID=1437360 RepID=UPI0012ABC9D2|nr:helix-turn-helix domain-containing protein [Bradyrhizobium erythrophlei]
MSASELEQLRDRVAMLEDILGVGQSMVARLRAAFDMQPAEGRVLGMLLNRQLITKDAIYNMLYGHKPECDQPVWKSIDVVIHKVRKKLRAHDIEFVCIIGEGYTMKPEHKLKVREHLGLYEGEGDQPKQPAPFENTDFPTIALARPPRVTKVYR